MRLHRSWNGGNQPGSCTAAPHALSFGAFQTHGAREGGQPDGSQERGRRYHLATPVSRGHWRLDPHSSPPTSAGTADVRRKTTATIDQRKLGPNCLKSRWNSCKALKKRHLRWRGTLLPHIRTPSSTLVTLRGLPAIATITGSRCAFLFVPSSSSCG